MDTAFMGLTSYRWMTITEIGTHRRRECATGIMPVHPRQVGSCHNVRQLPSRDVATMTTVVSVIVDYRR